MTILMGLFLSFLKPNKRFSTLFNCGLDPLNTEFPRSLCAARHFCSVDGWTLQNLIWYRITFIIQILSVGILTGLTKCSAWFVSFFYAAALKPLRLLNDHHHLLLTTVPKKMLHLQNKSQNKETHFNEIPSILNKFHHAKKISAQQWDDFPLVF